MQKHTTLLVVLQCRSCVSLLLFRRKNNPSSEKKVVVFRSSNGEWRLHGLDTRTVFVSVSRAIAQGMSIPALDSSEVLTIAFGSNLQVRLARLLFLVARCSDEKMKLAVGGAIAAHAAGWKRFTDDLDLFARPVSAKRLVKRLREEGMSTFWITDAHAVAYLKEDNEASIAAGEAPSVRIDVLSTLSEPEASAIRTAVAAPSLGVPLKVFRSDYLAAIKYLAGRPQDLVDFDELVLRKVDLERVRYLIATVDEAKASAAVARARKVLKPKGVGEKRGQYLSRDGFQEAWRAAYAKHLAETQQ